MNSFRPSLKPPIWPGVAGLVLVCGLTGAPPGRPAASEDSVSCHAAPPPDSVSCHAVSTPAVGESAAVDRADTTGLTRMPVRPERVGVEEKLGAPADLDLIFKDEQGQPQKLADLVDRPTLLLPVYYHCPAACQMMLGGLSSLVDDIPLEPGEDYRILAVSFDHDDTPEIAAKTKANYIRLIKKEFAPEYFMYLTGGRSEILELLGSAGYKFQQTEPHSFLHPNALVVLSADGTIIRYLYGPSFLAFDIGLALTEAERGTPSLSIRRLMTYCFSYNPEKKTYTFTAVRYVMFGALFLLGLVMFLLLRKKRRKALTGT